MTSSQPTQPLTDAAELDEARAAVESWHDAMPFRLDELDVLLEAFDRLRSENAAQAAKLDHFKEQHQPVTVDWSASPKCKANHGPAWVNWPCPDAFVLGMTKGDTDE